MHIAEGVAPLPLAAAGFGLAAAGVAIGLRSLREDEVPRTALVTAALFVASTALRLPLGPSSVHPVLCGLAGLMLGWAAFPAFLVSLFLQALLLQFGGITTLGINVVVMGAPAVLVHLLLGPGLRQARSPRRVFWRGAAAGALGLTAAFGLWAGALILSGRELGMIAALALGPHLLLTAVEAAMTGFIVAFLVRVRPEALIGRSRP